MGDEQKSILLVDDEPEIRRLLESILTFNNYKVWMAESAEEAQEVIKEADRINLLITDIALPKASGFSIISHYKGRFPDGKVLFMSGVLTGGLRPPGDDFIPKPFMIDDILQKIRRLLGEGPPE